jgi:hypothetical protein
VFVDFGSECITLYMTLSASSDAEWSIRATQFQSDHPNLAPTGCTQYFYGENTGELKTYNFAGGQHLADQKQTMCIRYSL